MGLHRSVHMWHPARQELCGTVDAVACMRSNDAAKTSSPHKSKASQEGGQAADRLELLRLLHDLRAVAVHESGADTFATAVTWRL